MKLDLRVSKLSSQKTWKNSEVGGSVELLNISECNVMSL